MSRSTGTRAAPRVRGFTLLVWGYAISTAGNYLNLVAFSLFAYEATRSATAVGVLIALRLASGVVMGLFASGLVLRFDRRSVMLCTDVAQASAAAVLAVWADAGSVALLAGAAVVLGAGNTLFTVSLRTAVPDWAGQRDLVRANGVLVTARSLATVVGFGCSGVVIGFGGFAAAFGINAASFVCSAVALLSAGRPVARDRPGKSPTAGPRPGFGFAGIATVLAAMVLLRGADAFGSSSHNVALPVLATLSGDGDPAWVMGAFWTAWAIGGVVSHRVVARWWPRVGAGGERAFAVGTVVMATAFTLAFAGLPVVAVAAAAFLAGVADGITEITYTSRVQAEPERVAARLFGLSATAETTGFAVGMVAAGALLDAWPPIAVVGAFHGCAAVAASVFLCIVRRRGERAVDVEV